MGCVQSQEKRGHNNGSIPAQLGPDGKKAGASTTAQILETTLKLERHRQLRLNHLQSVKCHVLDCTLTSIAEHIGGFTAAKAGDFSKILDVVQGVVSPGEPFTLCSFVDGDVAKLEPFVEALAQQDKVPQNAAGICDAQDPAGSSSSVTAGMSHVPSGLIKCKQYGLRHVIINVWLTRGNAINNDTAPLLAAHLRRLCAWVGTNLAYGQSTGKTTPSRAYINLCDFCGAIADPNLLEAALHLVHALSAVNPKYKPATGPEARPFALILTDAKGTSFPLDFASCVQVLRTAMSEGGWAAGTVLVSSRRGYGMAQASMLECLASGANGVYSGVCDEAAGVGTACYLVTGTNLCRLGNKHMSKAELVKQHKAARTVVALATGTPPHPRAEVYGDRALDICFDATSVMAGISAGELLGLELNHRISQLASPPMIIGRMKELFGEHPEGYDMSVAVHMLELVHEDMLAGKKLDYNPPWMVAMLWERAGGRLTPAMSKAITAQHEDTNLNPLVQQLRVYWDEWEAAEEEQDPNRKSGFLSYYSFYEGFMARYFSCFVCDATTAAFKMFDTDKSHDIQWEELLFRAKWALHEFKDQISDVTSLTKVIFERMILPEMQRLVSEGAVDGKGVTLPKVPSKQTPRLADTLYDEWKKSMVRGQVVGVNIPFVDDLTSEANTRPRRRSSSGAGAEACIVPGVPNTPPRAVESPVASNGTKATN